MNYDNYERKVVENWGVELRGWTSAKVVNPAKLGGRPAVIALWKALSNESCRWEKLTEAELKDRIESNHQHEAAGEEVYKPRKTAAKKAIKKSEARSAEFINDED